jgi:hypothetical protein
VGTSAECSILGVEVLSQRSRLLRIPHHRFGNVLSDSDWFLRSSHHKDGTHSWNDSAVSSYTRSAHVAQLLLTRHRLSASFSKNTPEHEHPTEHLAFLPDQETGFIFRHPPSPHSRRSRFRQHVRQHFRSLFSFLAHASEPAEQLSFTNETNQKDVYMISEEIFCEVFSFDKNNTIVTRDCSCHNPPKSQVNMSQQTLYTNATYSELLGSSVMELPGTPHVTPRYAELPAPVYYNNVAPTYTEPATVHTAQTAGLTPTLPSLSPQSASEDQSPVSPFTPSTTGSIPEPRQLHKSNALLHNGSYEVPAHMRQSYDAPVVTMTADQPVQYFDPSFGVDFGFHAAQTDLFDFEQGLSTLETPVALVRTNVQQAATLPSRLPALQPTSFRPHDPRVGTWCRNPDATWSRCDEEASTLRTHDENSNDPFEQIILSRDHKDHDMVELESEGDELVSQPGTQPTATKKKREKEYALVYCKHCKQRYSGRYARGNMKRHVLLKHTLKMGKTFGCSMCEKAYNRSDARRNHERSKHSALGHMPPTPRSASSA